ncbi:phage terminase, large subunit, PBSX family [Paenibacillus curdlanolyticus YK9]|uniref:Phage terminase, large subunit, PBSX family n=1 Tax=Paenibacillus curdlanolyticus YK9 TaxID=717606 RepID=E0IBS9_9BACL|nr:terminase family protein [Paenibacillus curdlanolyticus]EFM10159.1 phage terminase, large subunit, PBSX family [Paenibacillus curdlanolyticus YK9]
MIEYAPLTAKQAEYIARSKDSWLNVAEGGKRAGKNIINLIAYAMCLEIHPDKLHLVAGVSLGAAKMNAVDSNGFGLQHLFAGRCREGEYKNRDALYIQTATGEKVVIIAGGGKANDAARIKGNSYGTVYITEVNECHQSFVQEAFDRTLASSKRQLFFDLNPKPPSHWFYRDVLDYQDELLKRGENSGYNYAHFTVMGNLSIPDDRLRAVLSTYDKGSLWYQADILGKRTAATGRIYTGYTSKDVVVTRSDIKDYRFIEFSIGIDIGGTDATVATLTGMTAKYENVVLLDGYYHKQGKESGFTHDRYAKEVVNKIVEWSETYPAFLSCAHIFAESADKLFRQALANELRRRGINIQVVAAYKKEGIVDRIRLTNILINQGRYKVMKHMAKWTEALENATWDEKERQAGEWVRTDDGSYPVDCLDSSEYAVQPFKRRLEV